MHLLRLAAFSVEAFRVCTPMKGLTGPELRRWHGRVVVGILLAGSAAFALVFWVTVWGMVALIAVRAG